MEVRRRDRYPTSELGGTRADRVRLFQSDWLEALTLMPPRLFAAVWGPLLLLIAWIGLGAVGPAAWLALFIAGLIAWSLFEYVMHRFLFHLEPRSGLGRRLAFVMHGNHHADPHDPHRAMMPLIVSLPWSGAIWAGCASMFGRPGSVIFLGFAIGYTCYDVIHHACHQSPVKSRLLRALRRHHFRHHFGRDQGDYAITGIFWDRLFGTLTKPKRAGPRHGGSSA